MDPDPELVADLDLVGGADELAGGVGEHCVAAPQHGEGAERVQGTCGPGQAQAGGSTELAGMCLQVQVGGGEAAAELLEAVAWV